MSKLLHNLDLTARPELEKFLGYRADRNWVAFYWEPEVNQVMYDDGRDISAGKNLAWQLFIEHSLVCPAIEKYLLNKSDRYCLLLDRQTRNLYICESKILPNIWQQQESLGLLTCLDSSKSGFQNRPEKARFFPIKQAIAIGISSGVIAAIALGSWLYFTPASSNKQAEKRAIAPTISSEQPEQKEFSPPTITNSCGVGGSQDFSSYTATSKQNQELHFIGVYESHSKHSGNHHPTGTINVKIERKNKPIILALSSYEPVEWNVILAPGVVVEKIILNGYHDQSVVGVSQIPVEEFSYEETGNYLGLVYRWDDGDPRGAKNYSLLPSLEQLFDTKLTSFQGCYRGTNFVIK